MGDKPCTLIIESTNPKEFSLRELYVSMKQKFSFRGNVKIVGGIVVCYLEYCPKGEKLEQKLKNLPVTYQRLAPFDSDSDLELYLGVLRKSRLNGEISDSTASEAKQERKNQQTPTRHEETISLLNEGDTESEDGNSAPSCSQPSTSTPSASKNKRKKVVKPAPESLPILTQEQAISLLNEGDTESQYF